MIKVLESEYIGNGIERCLCYGYEIAILDESSIVVQEREEGEILECTEAKYHTVHIPMGYRCRRVKPSEGERR